MQRTRLFSKFRCLQVGPAQDRVLHGSDKEMPISTGKTWSKTVPTWATSLYPMLGRG